MSASYANILASAVQRASKTKPLSPDQNKRFFDVMQLMWDVSDRHGINLDFTTFILFGQQSAGKTSLVERWLGFPVSVVRQGTGTRRPLVVKVMTSGPGTERVFTIQEEGEEPFEVSIEKVHEVIMELNDEKHIGVPITDRKLYLTVQGPDLTPMRFIDMPGLQLVGIEKSGIQELVRSMLDDKNAYFVGVEAGADWNNSTLAHALKHDLGLTEVERKKLLSRMIFCMNKSDRVLQDQSNPETLAEFLAKYAADFKQLPILVGENNSKPVRDKRAADKASFDDIRTDYEKADDREAALIGKYSTTLQATVGDVANNVGFQALTGRIKRQIHDRDFKRMNTFVSQLLKQKADLEKEVAKWSDIEKTTEQALLNLPYTLESLMSSVTQIANDRPGHDLTEIVSPEDFESHGLTLPEEEKQLYTEFYPMFVNELTDISGSFHGRYRPDETLVDAWLEFIATAATPEIDFAEVPMLTGQIWIRAQKAIAAHLYGFNKSHFQKDKNRLINLSGFNAFWNGEKSAERAKKLAEVFANRLRPGVHYACVRAAFILKHIFKGCLRVLGNNSRVGTICQLLGDEFKEAVVTVFDELVSERLQDTYTAVMHDLDNEIAKLDVYSPTAPAISGILAAFPNVREQLQDQFHRHFKTGEHEPKEKPFHDIIKSVSDFFKHTKQATPPGFLDGVTEAMKLLQFSGSNPITSCAPILLRNILEEQFEDDGGEKTDGDENSSRKPINMTSTTTNLTPQSAQALYGMATTMYAHFISRFITTILQRISSDLVGAPNEPEFNERFRYKVLQQGFEEKVKARAAALKASLEPYRDQIKDIQNVVDQVKAAIGAVASEIGKNQLNPVDGLGENVMGIKPVYGQQRRRKKMPAFTSGGPRDVYAKARERQQRTLEDMRVKAEQERVAAAQRKKAAEAEAQKQQEKADKAAKQSAEDAEKAAKQAADKAADEARRKRREEDLKRTAAEAKAKQEAAQAKAKKKEADAKAKKKEADAKAKKKGKKKKKGEEENLENLLKASNSKKKK